MNTDKQPRTTRQSPDYKYGWVVVVAAAFGFSLIIGLGRVSGVIYVLIIDNYQVTRAEASTIYMTARFFSFISTPITSKLLTKYTYSILICIGGFLLFTGLILSAFATSLWQLVITYGALIGIGGPMVITPGILAINTSFKEKHPLAISIYFTIGGASGLAIPFFFEVLLDKYLLSGAFLMYSGLMLNICCCGLLVTQPANQRSIKCGSENEISTTEKSFLHKIINEIKNDIKIFKDPIFLVLLICRILLMMPLLNVIQFIPDFVEKDLNLGLSKMKIASLLSVISIGDVCARILAGTFFSKLPWPKKFTYGFLSATVGIFMFSLLFVRSYAFLLALHIIFGLQLGILSVFQYILEVDLMGVEKTPLSLGITQSMGNVASLIMMYSVGYIRDVTGSYTVGFSVMGVSAILSGMFWVCEPCFKRCLPHKEQI